MSALLGCAGCAPPEELRAMCEALRHRGDRAAVARFGADAALGAVSRRPGAPGVDGREADAPHGPAADAAGRVTAVVDGLFTNAAELCAALGLPGGARRGAAALAAAAYARWGLDLLPRVRGAFTLAVWDAVSRRLLLARDAAGARSLVYHVGAKRLLFASEARALFAAPEVPRALDPDALHLRFNLGYTPAPRTAFRDLHRLPPGSLLVWEDGRVTTRRWFEPPAAPETGLVIEQACDGFLLRLRRAVREAEDALDGAGSAERPVPTWLAGDLPGATVAAARAPGAPTLTVAFIGREDPRPRCRDFARRQGADHADLLLAPDLAAALDEAVWALEEPAAGFVETALGLRALAARTPALLDAAGARELFLGEDIYQVLWPLWHAPQVLPARAVHHFVEPLVDRGSRWLKRLLPSPFLDLPRHGLETTLTAGDAPRAYAQVRGAWDFSGAAGTFLYRREFQARIGVRSRDFFAACFTGDRPPLAQVRACEVEHRLADRVLLYRERLAAARGLELLSPYCDADLVQYALGVPVEMTLALGQLLALVRRAHQGLLPQELLERDRARLPVLPAKDERRALLALAREVLTPAALAEQGLFRTKWVRAVLDRPVSEALRWHYELLTLMLATQRWAALLLGARPAPPPFAVPPWRVEPVIRER